MRIQSSMAVVDRLDVSPHDDAWQMSIQYGHDGDSLVSKRKNEATLRTDGSSRTNKISFRLAQICSSGFPITRKAYIGRRSLRR